jgi:hypothetical protein
LGIPLPFAGEFEVVIMIAVGIEEMDGFEVCIPSIIMLFDWPFAGVIPTKKDLGPALNEISAPLASLVVDVRKTVGALGIHPCVPERHLLILGTRPGTNRFRGRQRLVNGAPAGDGHLGLLMRAWPFIRIAEATQPAGTTQSMSVMERFFTSYLVFTDSIEDRVHCSE